MTSSFSPDAEAAVFVPDPLPLAGEEWRPGQVAVANASNAPDPEAVREEAYHRGVEAGRAELPVREAERLDTAAAALERATARLQERATSLQQIERGAVIELALAVAQRILEREIRADPDALAPLLGRALEALPQATGLTVFLSPGDLETVSAGQAPAFERLRGARAAELAADPELRDGDVRLEAGASAVDARLDEVLDRFRRELRELVTVEDERS